MRHFTTIIFLFFSTAAFSQQVDKEMFINQVYQKLVDSSFPYYLLSEQAYNLNRSDLILSQNITDSVQSEIEQNYLRDSLEYFWVYEKLDKARKINRDSLSIITGSILRIFSSKAKTKRRRKKEEAEQIKLQQKLDEQIPMYQKRVYFFSNPVFDNNKTYAIIKMSYSCGFNCGYGCIYLYRLVNNKWIVISKGTCIAS